MGGGPKRRRVGYPSHSPSRRESSKALLAQGARGSPLQLVTDKLQSYVASCRELGLSATHRTGQYKKFAGAACRCPMTRTYNCMCIVPLLGHVRATSHSADAAECRAHGAPAGLAGAGGLRQSHRDRAARLPPVRIPRRPRPAVIGHLHAGLARPQCWSKVRVRG